MDYFSVRGENGFIKKKSKITSYRIDTDTDNVPAGTPKRQEG